MLENCSLVVSSCDKYASVWPAYFGLLKKYWPGHPKDIYLCTETKNFKCDGLQITVVNPGISCTWSERLYQCLKQVHTKYIIFSLEDFFLLDTVKEGRIKQCMTWMEEDDSIAVCRLYPSSLDKLKDKWKDSDFRIAKNDILFRLDTQAALWNRETLISFLDLKENPWQFEEIGSKRVSSSDKKFLWFYHETEDDIKTMIFPYINDPNKGYNVHWGRWLWKNKKFLEENDIFGIDYHQLGCLSERSVKRRYKYLYNQNPAGIFKLIQRVYRIVDQIEKVAQNIRIYGMADGVRISIGRNKV